MASICDSWPKLADCLLSLTGSVQLKDLQLSCEHNVKRPPPLALYSLIVLGRLNIPFHLMLPFSLAMSLAAWVLRLRVISLFFPPVFQVHESKSRSGDPEKSDVPWAARGCL